MIQTEQEVDRDRKDSLLDVLVKSSQDRWALLLFEFQEEKRKYIQLLAWTGLSLILGTQALLITSLAIFYLAPIEFRTPVAAISIIAYWSFFVVTIFRMKRAARRTDTPFEASLEQLRKDLQCLRQND